jgi:alpha-galactosidase
MVPVIISENGGTDGVRGDGASIADADIVHLRAGGVSLVVDCRGPGLPTVLHWGADLGHLDRSELEAVALAAVPPNATNALDQPIRLGLLPEHGAGWQGQPGLSGHRGGRDWSPLFVVSAVEKGPAEETDTGGRLAVDAEDPAAMLAISIRIELTESGLMRLQAAVRNEHSTEDYAVAGLLLALPVPSEATELLDLTGRHLRERAPQRHPFHIGSSVRDNRRGRTGADATLVMVAGSRKFGFRSGEVWGLHVAWSGNHRTYAERLPSGLAVLGGGELLLPGEISLRPGEEYVAPWLFASYGRGLDELAGRFHTWLRARRTHPGVDRPRPVVLNTWEAVYFDHDTDRLRDLAILAAEIGVERFVLDDGWFRHRRDDTAGLGDWYVDERVWPDGLHPLVDHVRGLGMEFGLWVEPEMVNPDSDLARAHPDWILSTGDRQPPLARNQQVLDLGNEDAYAYLWERIHALLSEYAISYLKWDHNRDLVDAGHLPGGEPGVHSQTAAVYRLLDELRARHPALEVESCSSGGARVDLGILQRTDRVWGSDSNDPLERQSIQRWTALLLPPELVGSHVGPARAHTTGRTHDLAFRAGTALFGHFGIEADLAAMTDADRAELRRWVACYKELRTLLHSGVVVRADHPDPALWVHGVVAPDGGHALFALVAMATGVAAPPGRVRLPGLAPDARYAIRPLPPGDTPHGPSSRTRPPWLQAGGITLPGRVLEDVGIQVPVLNPEQLTLLELIAT